MEQKPRILILSTAYTPLIGGSELAIRNITDRLPEFEFDLVTGRYTQDMAPIEHVGRVRVFRTGGSIARLNILLPKLCMPIAIAITALRLMREHRYVLMHAYQASQAAGAGVLVKSIHPGLPFLLTLQEGKELHQQLCIVRIMRWMIFRFVDRITVISSYLAAYAHQRSKAPIDCIPNGVDIRAIFSETSHAPTHTIISVSRLVKKNNVANLIRALPQVRHAIPDARLVLVGDGPLRKELELLAIDQDVAGAVDFIGTVQPEQLGAVLHGAAVFARPSLSEGLGTAFLEAMAAHVPVVASRVGGIPDIVHDGETGLFCDPNSPADIAHQIVRLMTDSALREHIITAASALIRAQYDWTIIAKQIGRVYHEVMHQTP